MKRRSTLILEHFSLAMRPSTYVEPDVITFADASFVKISPETNNLHVYDDKSMLLGVVGSNRVGLVSRIAEIVSPK